MEKSGLEWEIDRLIWYSGLQGSGLYSEQMVVNLFLGAPYGM